jgi:hypothetical protein
MSIRRRVRRATVALVALAGWSSPAQQPTKATTPATADQSKKSSSVGTFRGRYRLADVPGKTGFESIKTVFQNLADCHTYDISPAKGANLDFSTEGFYIVVGRVVENRIEGTSSTKADEAAAGQLSALARKCDARK